MKAWLDIDGGADSCTTSVTQDIRVAAAGDLVLPLLAGLSAIQRPLSVPGISPAPTSNMDATLDNASGQVTLSLIHI